MIVLAEALLAFTVRGWTVPIIVLAVVVLTAARAGVLRGFAPYVLATIPFVVSVMLINTFLYPGARDVLFDLGPFAATREGLVDALQTSLRVVAFAVSAALFALTTATEQLVADLERRGLGRRASFVLGTAVGLLPRLLERAREITDAQRARGLDTEGGIVRRMRGVIPLAGPLVIGALSDVEERAMALEARGISAPGRRTVLRAHPDSEGQRIVRWGLLALTVATIVAAAAGRLAWLP